MYMIDPHAICLWSTFFKGSAKILEKLSLFKSRIPACLDENMPYTEIQNVIDTLIITAKAVRTKSTAMLR